VVIMTPTLLATLALSIWPVVVFTLYRVRPIGQATLWAILGAYLLLPVGTSIKFEGVPQFDKSTIANLSALLGCILIAGRSIRFSNGFGLAEVFVLTLVVGPFVTSELNGDSIAVGDRVLPGVGHYDALSAAVAQFLFFIPFFLGRQFLNGATDTADILRVLIVAGLLYSLPALFEVRMSPQLHTWVYGYFPHSFLQQIREGGFRPVVFLGHGLLVAFFFMTTVVAAAAYWRARVPLGRLPATGMAAYLGGVLVLCKTLGALVYGVALTLLVRFTPPRLQMHFALALVAIALLYPTLRATDLFPTRTLVELAQSIDEERAQSLKFRFDNEDMLLDRAWQRFLVGWGRFGRNRVYDEESGQDLSVTDGRWVITMGTFGLMGFTAEFGLLALAVVRAASAFKLAESEEEQVFLAALALIVAITVVDQLPNASLSPWTWLLAGALLGRAEAMRVEATQPEPSLDSAPAKIGKRRITQIGREV
jgi:hypothetical protein